MNYTFIFGDIQFINDNHAEVKAHTQRTKYFKDDIEAEEYAEMCISENSYGYDSYIIKELYDGTIDFIRN